MTITSRRSKESQEYRDSLAHDIKNLRWYGDSWKELADALLENERATGKYNDSFGEQINEETRHTSRRIDKKQIDKKTADRMIEKGEVKYVAEHLHTHIFKLLDKETADKLIDAWYAEYVAWNISSFKKTDHKDIANKLIDTLPEWSYDIIRYFDHFEWLDKEIADKLIDAWYARLVAYFAWNFKWLDRETAEKLINAWEWQEVAKHPWEFWLKKEK